jgi:hypothetical protein
MHPTIPRPAPNLVPPGPKNHHTQKRNPRDEAAKQHHRRDVAVVGGPVVDKVCLPEAEGVPADGGNDHDFAGDGLVGVDGIL